MDLELGTIHEQSKEEEEEEGVPLMLEEIEEQQHGVGSGVGKKDTNTRSV